MDLKERIGIDLGRRIRLEEGIEWAARHGVRYIDVQLDTGVNAFDAFDAARAKGVRAACDKHGVHLGLHTLSAVNVAEYSPYVRDVVDRYLRGYMDVSRRLGAEWIVVHTVNHAHLVPEGVDGFIDGLDFSRVAEVRLADCFRLGKEVHLKPGAGDLDFAHMFKRVEGKGFTGHYTNAFGSLEDMLTARDDLAAKAAGVGVQ